MIEEGRPFGGTARYAVRRHIGGGSMGLVYEAFDRERKMPVAIKTLRSATGDALYRLKQEFRALSDLSHPNLVNLYELVGEDGDWFIVMELVQGVGFLEWVRGQTAEDASISQTISFTSGTYDDPESLGAMVQLPPAAACPEPARLRDAFVQTVRGVAALHAAGRLHMDLKPSNVLVGTDGRVVLVDFGLVYDVDRAASELSRVDKVVGTAAYMAPEQARGEQPSEASDLYCLGVMLFQGLTGRLPFEGTLLQMLLRKQDAEPPRPSSVILDVPPDLDQLCVDLIARDPVDRPTARDVLRRLGEPVHTPADLVSRPALARRPLIGREAAVQELEEAWAAARAGRATAVLVRGAAGMGKTSLVRHFLRQVRRHEDVIVLRGRCHEREQVPFKAFDAVIDALRRTLDKVPDADVRAAVVPPDAHALVRLFPTLQGVVTGPPPPDLPADPVDLRHRAFAAFRTLVHNLTALRPVIVFLDDVQWGDRDSARLLSALLRDLRECRLMFALAWRTEDEHTSEFLLTLLGDPALGAVQARSVAVGPLEPDDAAAVAAELLADTLSDPLAAARRVARDSGGNPFLVSELAELIIARAEAGVAEPAGTADDLFALRYSALNGTARSLLAVIALVARPVPLTVVERAAGVTEGVVDALAVLDAWRLVRSTRGPLGELVEPYHDRVARAVAGLLGDAERTELHVRIARALEGSAFADPEMLLHHCEEGGLRERAAFLAQEAARAASDALAFDRAAALYAKALALRDWGWEETEHLRVAHGDALVYAGRGEAAARAYLEAASHAGAETAARLRRKAAGQLLYTGRVDEGLALVAGDLAGWGVRLDSNRTRLGLAMLARRVCLRFRGIDVTPRPEREHPTATLEELDALWFVTLGLSPIDPVLGAWLHAVHLHRALSIAEPYRLARALSMELAIAAAFGNADPARQARLVRRGRDLGQKAGRAHAVGLVALGEGFAAYLEGRWQVARRTLARAGRIFREQCVGVAFESGLCAVMGLRAAAWAGSLRDAQAEAVALAQTAADQDDLFLATAARSGLALWPLLATGELDRARALLDEARTRWGRKTWDLMRVDALINDAELSMADNRPDDAVELLAAAAPEVAAARLDRVAVYRIRWIDVAARARLASDRPDGWAAVDGLARSLARVPVPNAAPLAAMLQAGLHARRGRPDAAMDALRPALLGFEQLGMALHVAVARYRLGELLHGNDGHREREIAVQWMLREGIGDPAAVTALFAPGIGPTGPSVRSGTVPPMPRAKGPGGRDAP